MSAAPSTKIDVRQLALAAYEASSDIARRIRRDNSKRLLFNRLASDRFGLGSILFDCTQVGFLEDDRAFIDIDDLRLAAPTETHIAGLYVVVDDIDHSIQDIADLGLIIATENL